MSDKPILGVATVSGGAWHRPGPTAGRTRCGFQVWERDLPPGAPLCRKCWRMMAA